MRSEKSLDILKESSLEHTLNIEMCAQYIFSHISRRALGAQKSDASGNLDGNTTNRINLYICTQI